MFQVNMIAHLWDLVDEGLEGALDLLQGRIGVTGICTPVTTPPAQHIRYAPDVTPRVFQTRGGTFFQPASDLYTGTRCRPLPSEWLKGRNPLHKLADECRRRGLPLRAVVECTGIGRVATHDPHFARKNVFGDVSTSQICLVNPDVAEFLRALVVDLRTNYGPEVVELTGLDAMTPLINETSSDVGLGGRQLLALCFCESCRQAAAAHDVDVESAARSTAVRLEDVFRTGRPIPSPLLALAADDPPLSAFLGWYRDRIAGLSGKLRESSGCRLLARTRRLGPHDDLLADFGYAAGTDGVVCDYAGWDSDRLQHLLATIRGSLGVEQRLEVQVGVCPPAAVDEQALFRILSHAAELGVPSVSLDHYGRLPRERVDLLKQAVRFPRRAYV
jgi:hypothetical protein